MDKNAIKKYAVWARTELIDRVRQRAVRYEVTADANPNVDSASGKVLTPIEKTQRQAAIARMRDKGYEYVIEEVAYTWFNRFAALRYMEVNNYLPSRVRVFTDENGSFKPQILTEAIHLNLDGVDMEKVYALKEAENNDELYKYLLITQCNALSAVLPQMFKPVDEKCKQEKDDYTILLFPDNLLREGSVVEQMISLISEDNWLDAVQIIGWLYQYYNIDPKAVIDAKVKKGVKVSKDEMPAKTQIFTPDWVVRYMVENSLGRLWLEGHPNDELKSDWKYYLEEAEQNSQVQNTLIGINKEYLTICPEDILCIDPCMGSGHIIAYMFDMLVGIYAAYGYSARESVQSIIEHNIHGLDIDDRAVQLAYFSIMMKAVQYDTRFLKRSEIPQPHIYAVRESNHLDSYALEYFCNGDKNLTFAMNTIIEEMKDAGEYGSILSVTKIDFDLLYSRFSEIQEDISMYREIVLNELLPFVKTAEVLSKKYDVVVTNPPYLGNGDMNDKLSAYIQEHYAIAKSDTFATFILRCRQFIKANRFQAMVTMQSWMNLGAFENLRVQVCETEDIITLWHLDDTLLGIAYQTAAFVLRSSRNSNYTGKYFFASKEDYSTHENDMYNAMNDAYKAEQDAFLELSGCPIAYSLGKKCIDSYVESKSMSDILVTREGMTTGNNDLFLRLWHEIDYTKREIKWFPYNKGGEFRKWYGNNEYFVNWENDGVEMRGFKDEKTGRVRSHNYNGEYAFTAGITWSAFSSRGATFRYSDDSFLFDSKGSKGFCRPELIMYVLAFLNSSVGEKYLSYFAGAKDKKPGHIISLPYRYDKDRFALINELAQQCVQISKEDWDSKEISWDFCKHPFVENKGTNLKEIYDSFTEIKKKFFEDLKQAEEKINGEFIAIYEVANEVSANVNTNDVTVALPDKSVDIRSFISYAVGCMFGRYSLDKDGLAYAGGKWDETKYKTFAADKDNIIPICDDEYFDDDITGLFVKFIETVYGKDTLDENLRFIADALGGKGTPKEVIREYFLSDKGFYADHCKMYQKRPIYWLFDSGKKNGFKALVYMHRYQPDTIARMRTDYVHEQQSRYRTAIADLENRIAGASTSERVRLAKKLSKLQDQSAEIHTYEEKIHHLADRMIAIDLDDGVKHNYEIFKDVLAKIK